MTSRKSVPLWILAGIFLTAAAPAKSDSRDDVLAGIQRCGAIQDDRTWLDCLYGAGQPMRAHLGLSPAPESQQRLVPQPSMAPPPIRTTARPAPRKKPSFFQTLIGDAPPFAVSKMASYRYEKTGAFVVALENGQEWRQADVEGGTVSWSKPPSSYLVTISEGAFGSFNLHTSDSPRTYKVQRIR